MCAKVHGPVPAHSEPASGRTAADTPSDPDFSDVSGFEYHETLSRRWDSVPCVHMPSSLQQQLARGWSGELRGWSHENGASLSPRKDDGATAIGRAGPGATRPSAAAHRVFVRCGPELKAWVSDGIRWVAARMCVYDPLSDAFARARGLVRVDQLAERSVLFAGLGSVGSELAVRIAQQGVGHMRLADPDVLSVSNISRHRLDLSHVGRSKVLALAEGLRRVNPLIEVQADPVNILEPSYDLRAAIGEASLVVCSPDKLLPRRVVNRLCVEQGRPVLFVGFYPNAVASEIIWVRPGVTACLACLHPEMVESATSDVPYAGETGQLGEPGLSIDIAHGANVAAAVAIGLLDEGARSAAFPPAVNRILVHAGCRPAGVYAVDFKEPFQVRWVLTHRRADCEVCGSTIRSETPLCDR